MEKAINYFTAPEERLSFSLEDKLVSELRKLHPEYFDKKAKEIEQRKETVQAIEEHITDTEVSTLFDEYALDHTEFKEADGIYEIAVKTHFMDDRLPDNYGYKGGAARALLLRSLDIDQNIQPRDVDIIRFSLEEPEPGLDNQLAAKYMPNDFAHGYGVEEISAADKYFISRDLTINEVFATDKQIFCTKQCLMDTLRRVIRVTEFEKKNWRGVSGQKMLSKAVRFFAEAAHKYGEIATLHLENWDFESYFISPFWLSLQLDRACEQSQEIAQNYVDFLVVLDQLPKEVNTVESAVDYLSNLMGEDNFYFRFAPINQFDIEERWLDIEEQMEA